MNSELRAVLGAISSEEQVDMSQVVKKAFNILIGIRKGELVLSTKKGEKIPPSALFL